MVSWYYFNCYRSLFLTSSLFSSSICFWCYKLYNVCFSVSFSTFKCYCNRCNLKIFNNNPPFLHHWSLEPTHSCIPAIPPNRASAIQWFTWTLASKRSTIWWYSRIWRSVYPPDLSCSNPSTSIQFVSGSKSPISTPTTVQFHSVAASSGVGPYLATTAAVLIGNPSPLLAYPSPALTSTSSTNLCPDYPDATKAAISAYSSPDYLTITATKFVTSSETRCLTLF